MSRPDDPFSLNLARIVFRLMTSPHGWDVRELKRELRISDRTYRKYRKTLQDRFAPLFNGKGQTLVREVPEDGARYLRIVEGLDLETPDSNLLASMAALHLARETFRFLKGTELQQALSEVLSGLRERISDKKFVLGHLFRNLDRMLHYVPDAPKDYAKHGDKLRSVIEALIFTKRAAIEYDGAGGPKRHEIEPLSLMLHRSALYLLARHAGDERVYTFAVDRMLSVRLLRERFSYPATKAFDPASHFADTFGIFVPPRKERKRTEVELVFANERWLKRYVRERRWHPTQEFRDLRDGRLRMKFRVDNLVEVVPWIRSFGEEVTVVRPKRVVTGDAAMARRR